MKKEKSVFYKSSISAAALFVLGNAVMVLPAESADIFTFLGFLAAAVTTVALSAVLSPLARVILDQKDNQKIYLRVAKLLCMAALAVYSLFVAADAFSDFTAFVKYLILPELPLWVITAVFGAVCLYFAFKRQEDTLKFSLICFVLTLVGVIFFFFATSGNFETEYIMPERLPHIKEALNAVAPYCLKAGLPVIILPFYCRMVFRDNCKGACICGVSAGFVLLSLCLITSVLLFSPELAGRLSYPYASAVSTVTVGKLYTRMDGFSYFIYFSAAIAKINICLFTAIESLKRINKI